MKNAAIITPTYGISIIPTEIIKNIISKTHITINHPTVLNQPIFPISLKTSNKSNPSVILLLANILAIPKLVKII